MRRREVLRVLGAVPVLGAMGGLTAARANTWPSRELTLINAYPPGAATDLTARAIAAGVEKRLKATVVVKNVVGGAGTLGTSQLAASKPDGYTMGIVGITSVVVAPHTMDLPYKPWEAFDFIAQAAELRYGIGVAANSPVKTIEDLIALSKQRRVTYSSNSPTNVTAMFQLAKLTGGNFRWVVFGGGAESVTQAAGGHVDAVIQTVTEMRPQIEAGALRLIASAAVDRWPEYPEVKTLREQGYDAVSSGPFGYAFPAGTDPEIRARTEKAFAEALADEEVKKQITALGVVPIYRSGAEFREYLKQIEANILPILEETGMRKKK